MPLCSGCFGSEDSRYARNANHAIRNHDPHASAGDSKEKWKVRISNRPDPAFRNAHLRPLALPARRRQALLVREAAPQSADPSRLTRQAAQNSRRLISLESFPSNERAREESVCTRPARFHPAFLKVLTDSPRSAVPAPLSRSPGSPAHR